MVKARPSSTDGTRCCVPTPTAKCQQKVAALLTDRTNAWTTATATAEDYISGARLVAFARIKSRLDCDQLELGLNEAQTAEIALGAAIKDEASLNRPTAALEKIRSLAQVVKRQLQLFQIHQVRRLEQHPI